jgi:WD40 repeat protein
LADLSADGKVHAGWGKDKTVRVVEVATGKAICQVSSKDLLAGCDLSRDGSLLLLRTVERDHRGRGDPDVKLQVWNTRTGKAISTLPGHKGMLSGGGVFSPDGTRIATVGYMDKTILVGEVATGREVYRFNVDDGGIWRVAFSPDGRTLVGGGISRAIRRELSPAIRRWDLTTGKEMPRMNDKLILEKHEYGVRALGLLPDGKRLITTDALGMVYFWEMNTGKLLLAVKAHQSGVYFLAVSADGKILLTKGATSALVWDLESLLRRKA